MDSIKQFIKLLRISHWSKAAFVFLGVFYADTYDYWPFAVAAAAAFCLMASAVYIYNDFQDIEEDRLHPHKRYRPLANGEISIDSAFIVLLILLVSGLVIGWFISPLLAAILGAYLLLNLAYNHLLKNIVVVDVVCIASGFMLRVLAGTVGIGLPISWWLMTIALLISTFIALCKRRLEKQLGLQLPVRDVLKRYSLKTLDLFITLLATACLLAYIAYVIVGQEESFYFLLTIPFAAIGLWRFTWLTMQACEIDDPISLFFSDNLSCINLICFIGLSVLAINS